MNLPRRTLTSHSCDCPGKSLARSSFSAGPMSYRESMIWVMFGLVESVIELLVPEVSIHDRKAFVNQIGWFEKHMRVCSCESDTAKVRL